MKYLQIVQICQQKSVTDKKSGQKIDSNWKCLYSKMNVNEEFDLEELIQDPFTKLIGKTK